MEGVEGGRDLGGRVNCHEGGGSTALVTKNAGCWFVTLAHVCLTRCVRRLFARSAVVGHAKYQS